MEDVLEVERLREENEAGMDCEDEQGVTDACDLGR